MKIMVNHTSATQREETPHAIKSTKNNTLRRQEAGADGRRQGYKGTSKTNVIKRRNGAAKTTITNGHKRRNGTSQTTTISIALKRRAQSVIKDRSIDARSRALIRYALETNDPWLPELVRRADEGEPILDTAGQLVIETTANGSL
jgi:hypothetical protein